MMMSSDNNIHPVTGDSLIDVNKGNMLSKEEECDYYRQRFNNVKIVLDESLKELNLYKERWRGVTTMQLLLKESKQENVKLSKHVKAQETAMSILQKRLDKNGLSTSVSIQEAELFVPGASKQAFDNLAKETARLRSLLKQDSGLLGKKSADEIEDMKGALEESESMNNQLKNKIKDMESIKLKLASDYEMAIENLTKEKREEKAKFEKELKSLEVKQFKNEERRKSEKNSPDLSAVQELKELLIKTVEKCNTLKEQIPSSFAGDQEACATNDIAQKPFMSQEDYNKLKLEHEEAKTMNQRWQAYNKEREKQIQTLNDRLQELSDPHKMTAMIEESTNQKTAELTRELALRNADNFELQKRISDLSKELSDKTNYQAQMQHDNSNVEILRQQIQVCTEDFNTERKDREKAVQKARVLQEDVTKLTTENTTLRRQIELLKKAQEQPNLSKPPSYESALSSSTHSTGSSPLPQYNSPSVQASSMNRHPLQTVPVQESPGQSVDQTITMPFRDYTPQSTAYPQNVGYRSPDSHPSMTSYNSMTRPMASNASGASTPPLSSNYPSMSRVPAPNALTSFTSPSGGSMHSSSYTRQFGSMPRQNIPGSMTPQLYNPSMPPVVRRGGSVKEEMACPKCSKRFSEDLLVSHIDVCQQ